MVSLGRRCGRGDEGFVARSPDGVVVLSDCGGRGCHSIRFADVDAQINEPRPVGIRDLVASPEEVQCATRAAMAHHRGFFSLAPDPTDRAALHAPDPRLQASVATVDSNSLHVATIPASRGLIVDRNGNPLVTNVTTTEILLSRQQAYLNPSVIGALATLTQSERQADADATSHNLQYDPYQPAPVMSERAPPGSAVHQIAPGRVPRRERARRVTQRSIPYGGRHGVAVARLRRTDHRRRDGRQSDLRLHDRLDLSARPASRTSTSSTCAASPVRARSR